MANRRAHTHAAAFGGEESVEQPVRILGGDPDAAIRHTDEHLLCLVLAGSDHQFAGPIRDRLHGLNAIHHQVDHHLLSWTRSAGTTGRAGANSIRNDTRWLTNSPCTSAMTSLT